MHLAQKIAEDPLFMPGTKYGNQSGQGGFRTVAKHSVNAKLGDTIVIYIASLRRGTFTINPNHLVDFQYAWRQLRIITDFEDSIERRNVTPEWGNDRKKYFDNKLQLPFNLRRE